jgi:hypothetical protein
MQTNDLHADTRKLREAGVAINDPVPWSRTRPDGYELKWLLSLAQGGNRGVAPFLIQDTTPREERIPQAFQHKNDVTGIDTLAIAVGELSKVRRWYCTVLGFAGTAITDSALGAEGLRYKVGPHTLDLLIPSKPESRLVNWLRNFGPSPYAAKLRSSSPSSLKLDAKLTHGARLSLNE